MFLGDLGMFLIIETGAKTTLLARNVLFGFTLVSARKKKSIPYVICPK